MDVSLILYALLAENLVKNGDFEEGPYIIPGTKWGVLIPSRVVDDHSPLPGWMVESLKAIKYIDGDIVGPARRGAAGREGARPPSRR